MNIGDAVFALALLVWMSVSVGPWWIGVLIFLVAWVVNLLTPSWRL